MYAIDFEDLKILKKESKGQKNTLKTTKFTTAKAI